MNDIKHQTQNATLASRESFSGRMLTESQLDEAMAISGIIHTQIHKSGSFKEKLTDYSHAFARNEKFDAMRSETIVRDIYQGQYGQTMNATRETLVAQETKLSSSDEVQAVSLNAAKSIEGLIKEGQTMPFYKAYDTASLSLASDLNITQDGAKNMMKDAYKKHFDKELYDHGKAVEDAYHKPVHQAELTARRAEKLENQSNQQNRTQSQSYS